MYPVNSKSRKAVFVLSLLSLSSLSLTNVESHKCLFAPENDLYLFDNVENLASMDEAGFNAAIDAVVNVYAPIIASHGGTLKVNRLWTDSTVNASAQQSGSSWILNMYGGLARRDEITVDGFQMVVCHELGHHLGGFPFKSSFSAWAASEGQADYFATQACAHMLWDGQTAENAKYKSIIPAEGKAVCDKNWTKETDRNLCYRTSMAGMSLAILLQKLGGPNDPTPKFNTPDPAKVTVTDTNHPKAQCRLDTYFGGALCTTHFDRTIIPGRNNPAGQGSNEAEMEMDKTSCGGKPSSAPQIRPACWFASKLHT